MSSLIEDRAPLKGLRTRPCLWNPPQAAFADSFQVPLALPHLSHLLSAVTSGHRKCMLTKD